MKMRRCLTDPHYWKNPALRRSREKCAETVIVRIRQLRSENPEQCQNIWCMMQTLSDVSNSDEDEVDAKFGAKIPAVFSCVSTKCYAKAA